VAVSSTTGANGSAILSVDSSTCAALLPGVLSVVAGSADVISFLGLGGLFTAHITGNLVVLATHLVNGGAAPLAPMLSVPVFMAVLGATKLLSCNLEARGRKILGPLLALQFLLLLGFLVLAVAEGAKNDPNAPCAVVAGMLGVAAMAVQSGLVQISLEGAPSTTIMTTNVTRFMIDVGELLRRGGPRDAAVIRSRVRHTWPAIFGFVLGCGLGAAFEAVAGLRSLALPAGLALLALVMGMAIEPAGDRRP
jgi:uncharacterized membrane protein YoaK (UPF0700 family)